MKKNYIQKLIPFIDKYRYHRGEESQPTITLTPLTNNTTYLVKDILFNTSAKLNVKDFTLEDEGGMKFGDLCAFNIVDGSRTIGTGIIIADYSGLTPPGSNPLPENSFAIGTAEGFYPIYISNKELLKAFFIDSLGYTNAVVGWNGASLLEVCNKFDTQHEPLSENAEGTTILIEDANLPVWNGKLIGTK